MFTIKHYLQYVNNLKIGKRQLSITKEKTNQKSKLNYEYKCRPATARVKSSETSRDLKGLHINFIPLAGARTEN